jgi:exosortase
MKAFPRVSLLRFGPPWLWAAALLLGLLWSDWPALAAMAGKWTSDPQYAHGYLVPVFAGVLLWLRRRDLHLARCRLSWWGVPLILLAINLRLASAVLFYEWLDGLSLLPCLAGVCLLLGGWRALRWAWPGIAFLAFMLPLPWYVEIALAAPLRSAATAASTYLLQTLGFTALAHGNVILLGKNEIGVAEACSGLSMLLVFFALAFALVLVLHRARWKKVALVTSAVPIAIFANILRITLTGVLFETAGQGTAKIFYHDLAGWLMMPLALGLFWLVLLFLDNLFFRPAPPGPLPLSLGGGGAGEASLSSSAPRRAAARRRKTGVAACAPADEHWRASA